MDPPSLPHPLPERPAQLPRSPRITTAMTQKFKKTNKVTISQGGRGRMRQEMEGQGLEARRMGDGEDSEGEEERDEPIPLTKPVWDNVG